MPKLGMGPIRREQICRAAAVVIAREGFAGTTMRLVAEEAGVSTGMLNHYFANRLQILTQTLVYVTERSQERYESAIAGMPPGVGRLEALLDSVLAGDRDSLETWHVWINVTGEAARVPSVRRTVEERLGVWFELLSRALEGVAPADRRGQVPWTWRVDALLTGLAVQALTSEAALEGPQIRDAVVDMALAGRAPVQAVRRRSAALAVAD